ncbi:glucose-6-phosphate isomerase [Sphingorhabdus lutea]|uniref:Glucose-6-phosphate isomerase n=1 Tax=Sphingorhabdus lutea TaxID=1913578 RepID=A0A1L3JBZ7_9SPHN|nr:glucose-6-phosphate isomerase [Sphingorhabdus lutea]APG62648.1 glucose-6-phosphate isomerase [Sphingorhabdus lutea]
MSFFDRLSNHNETKLLSLFDQDAQRVENFSVIEKGVYFDFSKNTLDADLISIFKDLFEQRNFEQRRGDLFAGKIVNPTEGRAAEHSAERGHGNVDSVAMAKALHLRMRAMVEAVEAGAFGEIDHLLHIGIGGSALGPKLLMDALGRENEGIDVHIVSNIDGAALQEIFKKIDPAKTLIAVASKTFTTTETLMNTQSALHWMEQAGVADPMGRIIALTAAPDKAVEWGVDESRILPFSETVGGRYSLWCSIGFPAAIGLGWAGFEELLEGASMMDRHFQNAPLHKNAPVLAAMVDQYYRQARGSGSRAVFAYDERLRLLPDYLQQLEMESNGKSVHVDGTFVDYPTAAVTWGGVGTDAQHAVFQLLHQGSDIIPVEFIVSKTPGHDLDAAHHEALLNNCFAQGAALMAGEANEDNARSYAGNRPSTTILVDDVDPFTLGALIAYYEHRCFANAVLLDINPFDQFGVELGKKMAKAMGGEGDVKFDASTQKLMQLAFDED